MTLQLKTLLKTTFRVRKENLRTTDRVIRDIRYLFGR